MCNNRQKRNQSCFERQTEFVENIEKQAKGKKQTMIR